MQGSFPLENTPYTAEDAQAWMSTRTTGTWSANDNLDVSVVNGMQIKVSRGLAWLNWARFKGIVYVNYDDFHFVLAMADGVQDRIDRIVVRHDQTTDPHTTYLAVRKGMPGANPVPPEIQRIEGVMYEIGIATVRIPRGAIELTPQNITDTRLDETVCGIMRDGVTGIPTQMLYDQWRIWFEAIVVQTTEKVSHDDVWAQFVHNATDIDVIRALGAI